MSGYVWCFTSFLLKAKTRRFRIIVGIGYERDHHLSPLLLVKDLIGAEMSKKYILNTHEMKNLILTKAPRKVNLDYASKNSFTNNIDLVKLK